MDQYLSAPWGATSFIFNVKIRDTSDNNGAGKTGLTNATSGLIISTVADNEATATTYTVAGSNVETIATLGTYVAPSANKIRFKEVDATNHPGLYQVQIANARLAVAGARSLTVTISGASDAEQTDLQIALTGVNNMTNGNSAPVLNTTTIAVVTDATHFTLSAGSADNDAYNGCTLIVRDQTTPGQIAVGVVSDYVGSTKGVVLSADPGIFTAVAGDYVQILPPNATTAEIQAALDGATLAASGNTFKGNITLSIP